MQSIFYIVKIIGLTIGLICFGQTIQISGIIENEDAEQLEGVTIFNEASKTGTISDFEGRFEIKSEIGAIVLFRFLGFEEQRIEIENSNFLTLVLIEDEQLLNTIVISASRRTERILDAPSSISTVQAKEIQNRALINATDILKDVNSVDIVKTGVMSQSIVVRGFNNYFSADVLTLVDSRIARIPSIRYNAMQMLPTQGDELDRIEVLRGPASALYGPNSANGVVHLISKSPIDDQYTKLSFAIGARVKIEDTIKTIDYINPDIDFQDLSDRIMTNMSVAHAEKINREKGKTQIGYRVSAQYFSGNDWKHNDVNEPDSVILGIQTADGRIPYYANGQQVPIDSIAAGVTGDLVPNFRDYHIEKFSLDSRMDFRFSDKQELILSGGTTTIDNIEMSPIGAAIGKNWQYSYAQARYRNDEFFAQAYINKNNTGDSYILATGEYTIDKSSLIGAQMQNSSLLPKLNIDLIYGADAFFTIPVTDYTISGNYEDEDNIQEYGLYAQGTKPISRKIELLGAIRADYHSVIDNVFFSPRGGIVVKPNPRDQVRLTFNRAFRTPATNAFFLDVKQLTLDSGMDVLAQGNLNGFQFNRNSNPFYENEIYPMFQTPFSENASDFYHIGEQQFNEDAWLSVLDAIENGFKEQLYENLPKDEADELFGQLQLGLILLLPQTLDGEYIGHSVRDLNLTTQESTIINARNIQDIKPLRQQETVNYELGYKGIPVKNLFITGDLYYTKIKNYLAPTLLTTPIVTLNRDDIRAYVEPILQERLENFGIISEPLVELLDANPEAGGNQNGSVDDEIIDIVLAATDLPLGTISPTDSESSSMIVATRNAGDFDVWGFDFSANCYLTESTKLSANFAYVSKDSILVDDIPFGYVALNAPKHKVGIGLVHEFASLQLTVGGRFKWQSGFPALSGSYVGHVDGYDELDVYASWRPKFVSGITVSANVSNVYNHVQQFFVGAPEIGRSGLLKLSFDLNEL